ncbi:hypothetical protein V6N11_064275 [Hibiscus sabdariffa]|uniref:Uncharacterized protein n=2 Tax=Hibiscus sabdariffa TaxID=183260 RepID=A0ABR2AET3_9ROSI
MLGFKTREEVGKEERSVKLRDDGNQQRINLEERAPSPRVPFSFTQENVVLPPLSPVSFSDYFKFNRNTTFNQLLDIPLSSQVQGHADGSLQPNDLPSHQHLASSS